MCNWYKAMKITYFIDLSSQWMDFCGSLEQNKLFFRSPDHGCEGMRGQGKMSISSPANDVFLFNQSAIYLQYPRFLLKSLNLSIPATILLTDINIK